MSRRIAPPCLLLVALFASGCLGVGPEPAPDLTWYEIRLPAPPPAERRSDLTVLLRTFSQAADLDRDELRFRSSDVEGGYWETHMWAQSVGAMVRENLERSLESWGGFAEVLMAEGLAGADLLLAGEVIRFEEDDRPEGWFGVVEIRIEVVRAADGRLVLGRRYHAESPAAARNVAEVVRALGRALGEVVGEIRADLARVPPAEPAGGAE